MPKSEESMRHSERPPAGLQGVLAAQLVARGMDHDRAAQIAEGLRNPNFQGAYVAPASDQASVRIRERSGTTNNS